MLHVQINPNSGVPVYRQVMDQIKYYAASGALKAAQQLPSIRDLASLLAVNPATIVKAYTELQHEGLIEMKQGKGAFVCEGAKGLSQSQARKALEGLARQLAVEASQMGASEETVIRVVHEQLEALKHE